MSVRTASSIVRQSVRWLSEPWLPAGKLVVLDGDPGVGKSTLTCDIAARMSRGELGGKPLASLLIGAEDDAESTVVPRLADAGASLDLVRIWDPAEPLCLPTDTERLRREIVAADAALTVLDPLSAFLDRHASPNADHTIRSALMPLSRVAADTGCAILVLRHLRKTPGGPALHRGLGSVGVMASARMGWMLGAHPRDDSLRVLTMTKSNLGPLPAAKVFALSGNRLVWLGEDDTVSADQLTGDVRNTAVKWLAAVLAKGCRSAEDVLAEATVAGIAERTLWRARLPLHVVSRKYFRVWYWCLPGQDPAIRFQGLPPLDELTSKLGQRDSREGMKDERKTV